MRRPVEGPTRARGRNGATRTLGGRQPDGRPESEVTRVGGSVASSSTGPRARGRPSAPPTGRADPRGPSAACPIRPVADGDGTRKARRFLFERATVEIGARTGTSVRRPAPPVAEGNRPPGHHAGRPTPARLPNAGCRAAARSAVASAAPGARRPGPAFRSLAHPVARKNRPSARRATQPDLARSPSAARTTTGDSGLGTYASKAGPPHATPGSTGRPVPASGHGTPGRRAGHRIAAPLRYLALRTRNAPRGVIMAAAREGARPALTNASANLPGVRAEGASGGAIGAEGRQGVPRIGKTGAPAVGSGHRATGASAMASTIGAGCSSATPTGRAAIGAAPAPSRFGKVSGERDARRHPSPAGPEDPARAEGPGSSAGAASTAGGTGARARHASAGERRFERDTDRAIGRDPRMRRAPGMPTPVDRMGAVPGHRAAARGRLAAGRARSTSRLEEAAREVFAPPPRRTRTSRAQVESTVPRARARHLSTRPAPVRASPSSALPRVRRPWR